MKLTILLLTISVLSVLAVDSYSQTTRLTINLEESTLKNILKEIESISEFRFWYSGDIDVENTISVSQNNKNIIEILDEVFKGTDIKYDIYGRQIALYRDNKPQFSMMLQQPGTREITGSVKDKAGQPLIGVTILIKGTTTGTITDISGNFRLDVPTDAKILVLSFIGMRTQEVDITDLTNITVEMEEDAIGLEEVVAIGYGTVKRSDLTGSVVSVRSNDLQKIPVTNINQALQGRAAGVQVRQNQSSPGGELSVRVRGINTFMGALDPLYVIDGIIGADINTISPSDIKSIEIMKDASSTAIYGSNGANGVVLITTKSGNIEKSSISFDSYLGWQKITRKLDMLNAQEWAEIDNARSILNGYAPIWDLNNLPANTDWQDELYNTAPIQNYNLSTTGGSKIRYFSSLNYINQDGIIANTGYQRYNFRLNLDTDISDRIKIGSRIGVSRSNRNKMKDENSYSVDSPVNTAYQLPPIVSPYDEAGNLKSFLSWTQANGNPLSIENPLHYQKNLIDKTFSTAISGSFFAEIELFRGLVFRPSLNCNLNSGKNGYYKSSTIFSSSAGYKNRASVNSYDSYSWNTDFILRYQNSFDNGHSINLLGGFIATSYYMEKMSAAVENFGLDLFEYHSLSAGSTISSVGSGRSEKNALAYISRIEYNYQRKYYFTFNSRYDGSSIFGIDNKWGFFPSGAIAWKLSEEQFIKNIGLIYDMKLRASYGITGSEALDPYASHSRMEGAFRYDINRQRQIGYIPTSLAVPDLQWEETAQLDIGLDASILNGRLGFIFDFYNKETSNLFLSVPVPLTSGVSSVTKNTGSLKSRGFEFNINAVISDAGFGWRTDFNIALQQQEVTNIGNVNEIILYVDKMGGPQDCFQVKVGQSLGSFYGYREDGIWQTADLAGLETEPMQFGAVVRPGDIRYVDQNNDNDITTADRVIIGNALPKFFGGWNNTFNYKGFDASLFFDYIYGNDIYNATNYRTLSVVTGTYNKLKEFKNYWTPENPSATVPALNSSTGGQYLSDGFYIEDGSYLRVREVTLGYSLPENILSKVKLSRMRVFLSATNLFTWTNYTGSNPDVNVTGQDSNLFNIEHGGYPYYRTFITGLNLTF